MLPSTLHLTHTSDATSARPATSLVLSCPSDGLPVISYWGPAFPSSLLGRHAGTPTPGNADTVEGSTLSSPTKHSLLRAQKAQILGAGVEAPEHPSLLPTQAEAWTGTPLISIQREGREIFPAFRTIRIDPHPLGASTRHLSTSTHPLGACTPQHGTASAPRCESNAPIPPETPGNDSELTGGSAQHDSGADSTPVVAGGCTIHATDDAAHIDLIIDLSVDAHGLVSERATLINRSDDPLSIGRLWLSLPLPAGATELLTHTGHHLRERSPQRQPLTEGFFSKESWMGRPDFNTSLLISAGEPGFNFEHGRTHAVHLAWSGNGTHFAIRTPYTHGLIGAGELLYPGEITLQNGEHYITPELVASWGNGLNEIASRYHARLRAQHPYFVNRPRPVTLNTWEAVYFNHDEQTMMDLARRAAQVGVERFVIDDGWFKGRRNDTRALGDWQVDTEVWPRGLNAIAKLVHSLGMEFGLWFEPEMISLDSDIARAHPEWVLRPEPSRLPLPGRDQYVIDLANPEAWDYLYTEISTLVEALGIDYIKWDHNRFVTEAISPYTGRPAVHGQTHALYALLDALRERFGHLEIESCSSGGGRIDLGILSRTDRVWASDCTDPLERVDIQRHTSLLVPPEMIGAHIAESPSHMTGRSTRLATRASVAFSGHLGIEWNILTMDDEQLAPLRRWIALYTQARREWSARNPLITGENGLPESSQNPAWGARAVHADITDPAVRLDGLVSPDERWSVWCFAARDTSEHYPYGLMRLPKLEADALYRVRPYGGPELYESLRNPSCRSDLEWWNEEGACVPGAVLSEWGIRPPHILPGTAVLIEVEKVS